MAPEAGPPTTSRASDTPGASPTSPATSTAPQGRDPSATYAGENDWQAVRELCLSLQREIPDLAPGIVGTIREQHPDYAVVPYEEHLHYVTTQLQHMLAGLAERRPQTMIEAEVRRDVGRRRAEQGLAVETLIASHHSAYRAIWNLLVTRSQEAGPGLAAQLLGLVGITWSWLETSTAVITEGHTEAMQTREQRRLVLGQQFMEALYGGRAGDPDTSLLARGLAFDPEDDFQAACCRVGTVSDGSTKELGRWARDRGHRFITAARGPSLVLLFQEIADRDLRHRLAALGAARVGLGMARPGLVGAAQSLADAESALQVAELRGTDGADAVGTDDTGPVVVAFEDDWLLAALLPQAHRLAPLLAPIAEAGSPAQSAHLRDAVRAYADSGFSITAAAESLQVHPNTVKYRLDRWQSRTGWDARTLDGLLRSLVAVATHA